VSVPFVSGGRADVHILGRRDSFCGMVLKGRAGLTGTGRYDGFHSTFVGAWGTPTNDAFCSQTLAAEDGSFALKVLQSCFTEGAPVYLTSGGVKTCVSVPYQAAAIRRDLVLLGRWNESCP
jgi:hypothetical protein